MTGSTTTVSEYKSNEIDDKETSAVQLNEAHDQVIWTQEGSYSGSDAVSIVHGGISIDSHRERTSLALVA